MHKCIIKLILGQYDKRGRPTYSGYCGIELSEDMRAFVFGGLQRVRRKTCPLATVPVLRDDFRELPAVPPQWARPSIVVEVEYRQKNGAGLRHAVLKDIRPDHPARQVVRSR